MNDERLLGKKTTERMLEGKDIDKQYSQTSVQCVIFSFTCLLVFPVSMSRALALFMLKFFM